MRNVSKRMRSDAISMTAAADSASVESLATMMPSPEQPTMGTLGRTLRTESSRSACSWSADAKTTASFGSGVAECGERRFGGPAPRDVRSIVKAAPGCGPSRQGDAWPPVRAALLPVPCSVVTTPAITCAPLHSNKKPLPMNARARRRTDPSDVRLRSSLLCVIDDPGKSTREKVQIETSDFRDWRALSFLHSARIWRAVNATVCAE